MSVHKGPNLSVSGKK
jgi:hypothetical protein